MTSWAPQPGAGRYQCSRARLVQPTCELHAEQHGDCRSTGKHRCQSQREGVERWGGPSPASLGKCWLLLPPPSAAAAAAAAEQHCRQLQRYSAPAAVAASAEQHYNNKRLLLLSLLCDHVTAVTALQCLQYCSSVGDQS